MLSVPVLSSLRQVYRAIFIILLQDLADERKDKEREDHTPDEEFVYLVYFVVQIKIRSRPVGYAAEYLISASSATSLFCRGMLLQTI